MPVLWSSIQSAPGEKVESSHDEAISVITIDSELVYSGHIGLAVPGVAHALLTQSSTPHVRDVDGALRPDCPAPACVSVLLISEPPSRVLVH